MRRPTVLLADDHVIFTDGIVRILKEHFDVVGTVRDGSSLLEAASRLHPDVIVTDISMPTLSGLDGLRQLKVKHDQSKVIFLTMHADAKLAAEAFRLGAKAFVVKQSSGEELVKAIEAVLLGQEVHELDLDGRCPDADVGSDQTGGSRIAFPAERGAALHRERPADEGNRLEPQPLAPHGRDDQVRNNA